jgi:hypothetical protein
MLCIQSYPLDTCTSSNLCLACSDNNCPRNCCNRDRIALRQQSLSKSRLRSYYATHYLQHTPSTSYVLRFARCFALLAYRWSRRTALLALPDAEQLFSLIPNVCQHQVRSARSALPFVLLLVCLDNAEAMYWICCEAEVVMYLINSRRQTRSRDKGQVVC